MDRGTRSDEGNFGRLNKSVSQSEIKTGTGKRTQLFAVVHKIESLLSSRLDLSSRESLLSRVLSSTLNGLRGKSGDLVLLCSWSWNRSDHARNGERDKELGKIHLDENGTSTSLQVEGAVRVSLQTSWNAFEGDDLAFLLVVTPSCIFLCRSLPSGPQRAHPDTRRMLTRRTPSTALQGCCTTY